MFECFKQLLIKFENIRIAFWSSWTDFFSVVSKIMTPMKILCLLVVQIEARYFIVDTENGKYLIQTKGGKCLSTIYYKYIYLQVSRIHTF